MNALYKDPWGSRGISPYSIYSNAQEIFDELERRSSDISLTKKLRDFWGEHTPPFLKKEGVISQYAYLSRPIITPNIEMTYFLDVIKLFKLEAKFLEYPDKFIAKSREKRSTIKLRFLEPPGKYGGSNERHHTIADFHAWEGKDVVDIDTDYGLKALDLHHLWFTNKYPELTSSIIDITEWFKKTRSSYKHYYTGYLSLFIQNGVLLENFVMSNEGEYKFFVEKILPSVHQVEEIFGLKPLIYPLLPFESEDNQRWTSYVDEDLHNFQTLFVQK